MSMPACGATDGRKVPTMSLKIQYWKIGGWLILLVVVVAAAVGIFLFR
jgi:hypothetical protein